MLKFKTAPNDVPIQTWPRMDHPAHTPITTTEVMGYYFIQLPLEQQAF